jgi:hypothetical protein
MNTYDHYVEMQELIDMLRKEGLNNYADAMLKAMEEGATGTEIFMALRWNVKNLIESKQCSDIAEIKARRLYQELDKALQ